MKILILLLFISTPAYADNWTASQKVGEGSYLVLHTIDWMQTRWIAKHGPAYYESFNTILGRNPSVGRVNMWFASTTILQPMIANMLPGKWRDIWIGAGIGVEFNLTTHNTSIGIKMDLP